MLGVNIDHIATLRQARGTAYPDPVHAAALCELAGADQITIHLREDRRHIQDRDLKILSETVKTRLNLEMAATEELVRIALEARPDTVCMVPERREELTTEGGLDVASDRGGAISRAVRMLQEAEINVSLFVDPDVDQLRAAKKVGSDAVELHTGAYSDAKGQAARHAELAKLVDAAKAARKFGLQVNAGHGLNYTNVIPVAKIGEIVEFNIGHSIISRAVLVGMMEAVAEMKRLIFQARSL
ncbi:MAG: pyridoxine 5'-phosphate synthase [Deltaproteobacteria bacterium]|nr:pyridoxine 5'-phosphate synthase [Deltaproteobacteria bacterium]